MITGLDHVQLAAPPGSEPALRAFYAGILGMTEVPKPEPLAARGGCWFEAGTARLHLGIDPGHRPSAKAHAAFRVPDADALAVRLTAAGVPVTRDAALPGIRRCFAHDPAGNRLEFLTAEDPPSATG
ncbi:VOC family protein [Streptomyces catenulae]|uniref:VOC family protein n=1 Tax=Streptomyces catenulae TaxID=66875 RepID=A0ABV2Z333_9ACTN|nr:VOC family protein [Streptomyces catenulae]